MSKGEEQKKMDKVIRQSIDENGRIVGIFDNSPALNMLVWNAESCLADPNVWMRASSIAGVTNYYEYVLLYVDNLLVVSD